MEDCSMPALFAAWKYKSLAIFSVTIIFVFGVLADYFFPNLENDFFVALLLFCASSLILSVVLSLEEPLLSEEIPANNNHAKERW
jgi:hypothetical protein